jgi:hypothetical protein
MPIPVLNEDGFLPAGIHDCSLAEIRERFGQFQRTDQRCRLMDRLEAFIQECRATGFVRSMMVDGSFVTAADAPNDIDLILVLDEHHDFFANLRPSSIMLYRSGTSNAASSLTPPSFRIRIPN